MKKLVFVLALVACGKSASKPKDAAIDAKAIDAAVDAQAIDAPVAQKAVPKKLVATGRSFCAVMSDKTVRCWGGNAYGQLGDGTQTDSTTPVTPRIKGVEDLAVGDAHVCALLDDGSVACWGRIGYGRAAPTLEPMGVPGVTNVNHVFAVRGAGCATAADDKLVCWGDVDAKGHVRTRGTAEHRVPTPVVGMDHVVELSLRGARRDDGGAYYFGDDRMPVLTQIKNAVEVDTTGDAMCARLKNGLVACASKQPLCAPAPAKAPPKKVTKAPAKKGKPAKAPAKKPAKGAKAVAKTPAKPAKPEPPPAMPVEAVKLSAAKELAFDAGACIVTTAGKLQCLDEHDRCKVITWPSLQGLLDVIGSCALAKAGEVLCWSEPRGKVSKVTGVTGATQLAVGSSQSCALANDEVWCWGKDFAATAIALDP